MSYLVLARKWRPQCFEEVVGQGPITTTLQNALRTGRLSHAYLFAGSRGVGKTSLARILAKALNCETGVTPSPCNKCPSCLEITAGSSLDVQEIDGASNTSVDDVRELRENIRYRPAKSRSRVYIIDEVHMLSTSAFNAFLKTLEEPPPHVTFIFATTEPHKVLPTIRDRCQRFDLKRISIKEITERLEDVVRNEEIKISQSGIFAVAQEADGSLRDALSLLDQVVSFVEGKEISDQEIFQVLGLVDRKLLHETIKAILDHAPVRCLELVDEAYTRGVDLVRFTRDLLHYFRDLVVVRLVKEGEEKGLVALAGDEIQLLRQMAGNSGEDELRLLFRIIAKGEEEVIRSASPKIVLEMCLVQASKMPRLLSLEEILRRLDDLEGKEGAVNFPGESAPAIKRAGPSSSLPEGPPEEKWEGKKDSVSSEKIEQVLVDPARDQETDKVEKPSQEEDRRKKERGKEGAQLKEQWYEFCERLKKDDAFLASLLEQGVPQALNPEAVVVGFPLKSFAGDRIREKQTLKKVNKLCQKHFSITKGIEIIELSVTEKDEKFSQEESDLTRKVKKEIIQDPIVQEAMDLFQGTVIEIKTTTGSKEP